MADNEVSFIIKLQDLVSGGLRTVQGNAAKLGNAFNIANNQIAAGFQKTKNIAGAVGKSITKDFVAGTKEVKYMSSTVEELRERLNRLRTMQATTPIAAEFRAATAEIKRTEAALHRLQTGGGSRLKTWMADAFSQIPGSQLLTNPLTIAGVGIVTAVKKGMDFQRQRKVFETLSGSQSVGDNLFAGIQQFTTKAPYSAKSIQDVSKTLLSFGMNAKQILPTITMMGNIADGDSSRFQRLGLALGEVMSQGHLTGQQLRQMTRLGFNPLEEIQKATGLSMEVLQKRMKAGAISADIVTKAMQRATGPGGRFHDLMNHINDSFSGQLNITLNKAGLILGKMGEKILPVLGKALSVVNSIFNWAIQHRTLLLSVFTGLAIALGIANIEAIGAAIGMGVMSVATGIASAAMFIFNNLIRDNPVGLLIAGIIALAMWFKHLWNTSEKFRGTIMGIWSAMKGFAEMLKNMVIDRIKALLEGIGAIGKAIAALFTGHFSEAWQEAKKAAVGIAGATPIGLAVGVVDAAKKMDWKGSYNKGFDQGLYDMMMHNFGKPKPGTPAAAMQATGGTDKTMKNTILSGGKAGTGKGEGIASGGPRNITINLKSLIEQLQIHAVTTQQGIREMEETVKEALLRLLNSANAQMGAS